MLPGFEISLLIQFSLAVFVIALTPGPDMTLFVGRAIAQGRKAGLACMAGAMTGIMIHTILIAIGLSALILASPQAFFALKIIGALYLAWLAIQATRQGSAFQPDKGKASNSLMRNWVTGVGINLANPKIILFFVTFLPQFVSPSDPDAPAKLLILGLLFIPLSLPIAISMVLAADRFANFLRASPRIMRIIDYVFAGVLLAFAVRILTAQNR